MEVPPRLLRAPLAFSGGALSTKGEAHGEEAQAYKKYGVGKGTVLTAWRLCRCNPLGAWPVHNRTCENQVSAYFHPLLALRRLNPNVFRLTGHLHAASAAFRSATLNTRERAQRWRRRIGLRPARVVRREEAHHRGDPGAA